MSERSSWAARRARKAVAAFRHDRSGAMAVEFALVVAPLIFMLFSIIELGIVFLVSLSLENATTDTARTIRTGAVQSGGGGSAVAIRNTICSKLGWLATQCTANLNVDVRTYANFANPAAPNPVNNGVWDSTALTYDPGVAGQIVIVRAYYQWKLLTPALKGGLQKLNNGVSLITSTATFRNEPY